MNAKSVPIIAPRSGLVSILSGALLLAAAPAHAQAKLDAHYVGRLAGLPIGKGSWTIDVADGHYSAAANAVTLGLIHLLTGASATGWTRGTMLSWNAMTSTYSATIKTSDKTDEVQLTVLGGTIKDAKVVPPVGPDPERVPLTEAHKVGVTDPMTASIMAVPGTGDLRSPDICKRKLSVFDGRLRYDVELSYKRTEQVRAERGYVGPAIVCSGKFVPVAGYNSSKIAIKFLMASHDIEVWLVPFTGTRLVLPFRAQVETPFGLGVVEATQFVITPSGKAASRGTKTQ